MTKERFIEYLKDLYLSLGKSLKSRTAVFWVAFGIRECMSEDRNVTVEAFGEICQVDVFALLDEVEAEYGL